MGTVRPLGMTDATMVWLNMEEAEASDNHGQEEPPAGSGTGAGAFSPAPPPDGGGWC
eukprot:CAMPEP_0181267292 /NCGR_PEP_ID=MMETSP1097-20121128/4807_1 /TAXON_ID=35684 /ORGANISM="Pseudopedinella elastica, Strain CCMP716" /LENGTH=56 /DNA_ID=CAMNT_0023366679 /DNA_START=177 /DNA_END=347 /DNA_ORIENTATION=+